MIIDLRDGHRLIKHSGDKNFRLISHEGAALGTVREDAVAVFCDVFNNSGVKLSGQ